MPLDPRYAPVIGRAFFNQPRPQNPNADRNQTSASTSATPSTISIVFWFALRAATLSLTRGWRGLDKGQARVHLNFRAFWASVIEPSRHSAYIWHMHGGAFVDRRPLPAPLCSADCTGRVPGSTSPEIISTLSISTTYATCASADSWRADSQSLSMASSPELPHV